MSNLVSILGTKLINLMRITRIFDTDFILVQKDTNGDQFTRIILWSDFKAQINESSSETIREITNTDSQAIGDDYISANSGNPVADIVFTLIDVSTSVKRITIKAELGGGDVNITPAGGQTIEGVAGVKVLTPGISITIAPITGGWSES
ncbi:MAG: hypothetical protein V3R25_09910 [Nitrosomonadaceae bacterium]